MRFFESIDAQSMFQLLLHTFLYYHKRSDSCACPKEFSGPHCEFLNELVAIHNLTIHEDINDTFGTVGLGVGNPTTGESSFAALGLGIFLVLCALATIFVSKKKIYGKLTSDENGSPGIVPSSDIPSAEQFNDDEGCHMHDVALN